MKRIALIAGSDRPIPATRGGATQTMMTHLIDVNEEIKNHRFLIYSYYDQEAAEASKQYSFADFRYYHAHKKLDLLCGLPYRLMRKISGGRTYIKTNFVSWCIRQIREDKPDVVIIEGNYFQTLQLKKALNIPLILHMHIDGLHIGTDNGRNILNACNGILVISDYCRRRVAQIDPSQNGKIRLLKNTIDVAHFNTDAYSDFRKQFRKEHGIAEDDKVFVYCGRIDEVKGVKEAIEAFSQLQNKNTYFLVIGSSAYKGSKKTDYIRSLEKMAKRLGRRVIFTGYICQEELPKYYAACDISLVPSKWQEAAGNVTIEALACNLPVIATTQGGIPEYADQAGCILVDCNNLVANLRDAMTALVVDNDLFCRKRQNARNIALQYDKYHYYENFCKLIAEVMS